MADLPPDSVRTLLAVVDEGTFDAAARAMHLTPSAVSQRIKQLEQRIGSVLVVRAKPVRLTETGAAVARYGRRLALLERDARAELGLTDAPLAVPVAVNADSLSTWFRRVVRELAADTRVALQVRREDQDHTAELLRQGMVVAAVTSAPRPVQGCVVRPLGVMRYHAVAAADFVERHLAGGPLADTLRSAPVVVFDDRDALQDTLARQVCGTDAGPVRHMMPDSMAFMEAIRAGVGWGVATDPQLSDIGTLVRIAPDSPVDVPLHWQQWKLDSDSLRRVADAVSAAAAAELISAPRARNRQG